MKPAVSTGLIAVLALTLVMSGCATIFSGTDDLITFESEPAGAMVVIEGVDRGRTPLTTSVKRSVNGADVAYRLDGYETRTFELGQEFNMTSILSLFCFPLCPAIDLLTGAVMEYDPHMYTLELMPRQGASPEAALQVDEIIDIEELADSEAAWRERIRPNVALVSSATRQIVILR